MTNARQERHQTGAPRADEADEEVESDADRRRRRARFLRELAEARELRERVAPHRSKVERLRRVVRMRSFRT